LAPSECEAALLLPRNASLQQQEQGGERYGNSVAQRPLHRQPACYSNFAITSKPRKSPSVTERLFSSPLRQTVNFAVVPGDIAPMALARSRAGRDTRGWIGVQIQPVTAEIADSLGMKTRDGALVVEPQEGSPAVITAVNGTAILRTGRIGR
jgi:hypothetical protein